MALDNPKLAEFLGALATQYTAETVVLRPTADKAWEYSKDGELLQADVSPLAVSRKGRRIYCIPAKPREGDFWNCVLHDEDDNVLREFTEQFPD